MYKEKKMKSKWESDTLDVSKFKIIGYEETDVNRNDRPTISYWQDTWRRLRENPVAMVSLCVLIILTIMVIIGPSLRGYDYINMNVVEKIRAAVKNTGLERIGWEGIFFQESGPEQEFR